MVKLKWSCRRGKIVISNDDDKIVISNDKQYLDTNYQPQPQSSFLDDKQYSDTNYQPQPQR
jgi:hypothetical protein